MDFADNTGDYDHLEELNESDFEIADNQPDIMGWDILDTHKNKVGEVSELLFNAETRKVRYIILDMESNDVGLDDGRVIIPIDIAVFDLDKDIVKLPGVSTTTLEFMPLYERGRIINKDTDNDIRRALDIPERDAPIKPGSLNVAQMRIFAKR
ncbi:PRC-barrel domain containing protein [Mucilaginibacter conchicola]|uniref:PRC-barrel domain containing protein n=1 Tax=Mucilaginibacter conchicola TaxID=2303333 RepID=A0A372NWL5_9SPHI|nr:PRC-barrel domain-containing protein [Mucilaginibacter conchicola]RFZ94251.1 PRC-barrel domain containing protein [Mucilaginibacter conchicola]